MNPISFGEIAPDPMARAASAASRVTRIHRSLLNPLSRLTGLKLWLSSDHTVSTSRPICHEPQCHPAKDRACMQMIQGLRKEARASCEPRCASCVEGYCVFSVPIPSETEAGGYIEGRTSSRMSASSKEANEPAPMLAPVIDLLKGIAQSFGEEPQPTLPAKTEPVAQAKLYMRQNLTGKLTLSDIARAVDLSEGYLSKLFRQAEGMSVGHYLIRERITYSCQQLVSTRKNVSEIAYAAGFESISHFNRTFKAYTHYSPKRYRLIHRTEAALD
jgi:AraC-like DNA-binding protein